MLQFMFMGRILALGQSNIINSQNETSVCSTLKNTRPNEANTFYGSFYVDEYPTIILGRSVLFVHERALEHFPNTCHF